MKNVFKFVLLACFFLTLIVCSESCNKPIVDPPVGEDGDTTYTGDTTALTNSQISAATVGASEMRNRIIWYAATELGNQESGYNNTKYGRWYGTNPAPWCAMFVSWVFTTEGHPLSNVQSPKGYAYCPSGYDYFKRIGALTGNPEPGDIVFYWNKRLGRCAHTGIFFKNNGDGTFKTLEGNVGTKVTWCTRSYSGYNGDLKLYAFAKPPQLSSPNVPTTTPRVTVENLNPCPGNEGRITYRNTSNKWAAFLINGGFAVPIAPNSSYPVNQRIPGQTYIITATIDGVEKLREPVRAEACKNHIVTLSGSF